MNVDAPSTADQVASALKFFDIDSVGATYARLPSISNRLFHITAGRAQFTLRITPTHSWIPIQNELAIHDQLSTSSVCTRHWRSNSHGERVARINSGYAMLATYIQGTPLDLDPGLDEHCYSAGRTLAQIHSARLRLPVKNPRAMLNQDAVEATYQWAGDNGTAVLIRRLLAGPRSFVRDWSTLPAGVLHGDYHRANIIVGSHPKGTLAILDFEHCTTGPYLVDLARAASDICMNASRLDATRLERFVEGYQSIRALQAMELERLSDWIRLSCAVLAAWCVDHNLDALAKSFLNTGLHL